MSSLPDVYLQTRFRSSAPVLQWPKAFAIITAWPTTGEIWSEEEIQIQAKLLQEVLEQRNVWRVELTGYSPTDGHSEPGWAVDLNFDGPVPWASAFASIPSTASWRISCLSASVIQNGSV